MAPATATLEERSRERLPLPVALTPPEALEILPHVRLEQILSDQGAYFDHDAQLRLTAEGAPLIENIGSKCSGICGTRVGPIVLSDRDNVKDD